MNAMVESELVPVVLRFVALAEKPCLATSIEYASKRLLTV